MTALGLLDCWTAVAVFVTINFWITTGDLRSPKETSEVRSEVRIRDEGLRLSAGRACAFVFGVVGIKLLIKSVVIKDLAIVYPHSF